VPTSPSAPSSDKAIETPVYVLKAQLFKALGHPVRIRTLELLCQGDQTVSALLADIGIEASHLSQHLAVLRRAGVVRTARRGNTVTYSLADAAMADMLTVARRFLLGSLSEATDALHAAAPYEAERP